VLPASISPILDINFYEKTYLEFCEAFRNESLHEMQRRWGWNGCKYFIQGFLRESFLNILFLSMPFVFGYIKLCPSRMTFICPSCAWLDVSREIQVSLLFLHSSNASWLVAQSKILLKKGITRITIFHTYEFYTEKYKPSACLVIQTRTPSSEI
jgi:hypothetical protein